MTRKLLSMLVFVCFFATNLHAQGLTASTPQEPVLQLDAYLASLQTGPGQSQQRTASSEATHVKSLIQDLPAAAYVKSGQMQLYGDGDPIALYTNLASLTSLSSFPGLPKANIEILTIRVVNASELNSGINVSSLTGFPNLKYVYIISEGNATPGQITAAVQNNNSQYDVFYRIARPN